MNGQICMAIQNRRVVTFFYDGGNRTVEPHCHGTSTAGNQVLRGFQTGGHSESGNPVQWKLFDLANVRNLTITAQTFPTNRPGYNPNDKGMSSVHCHV